MRVLALGIWLTALACGCGETAATTDPGTGGGTPTGTTSAQGGAGGTTSPTTTGEAGSGGETTTTPIGGGGSGGAGGTAGAGGAGGSGGSGGTGGSTTTTSTTSTTTTQTDCVWGDDCGSENKYCLAPGCQNGTCIQKPPAAGLPPDPTPVCGCDGVTYWNLEVAASQGMSVAMDGACTTMIACGPDMACPSNMKCSRPVADAASCSEDATGECWGTPLSCSLDGPKARACTTDTCELQCSLIQSQNPWFEDPTCD